MDQGLVTEWFGVTIFRPSNLVTNILVGVAGAILAWLIDRKTPVKSAYHYYWMGFFIGVGFGGVVGGIAHAFNYDFPEVRHQPLHKIAWIIASSGLFCGELAAVSLWPNQTWRNRLAWFVRIKFLLFVMAIIYITLFDAHTFNHFNLAQGNTVIAILGVMVPLHILTRHPGTKYLLAGVLTLFFTLVLYLNDLSLANWCDYNDLSHFVEIAGLVWMYGGVRQHPASILNERAIP